MEKVNDTVIPENLMAVLKSPTATEANNRLRELLRQNPALTNDPLVDSLREQIHASTDLRRQ